jgi:hypothetical protein
MCEPDTSGRHPFFWTMREQPSPGLVPVENSVLSQMLSNATRVECTNSPRFCWRRRDTGFSRAKPWRLVVSSARENYSVEDARSFLTGQGLDANALAKEVDDKFVSAFVRAVKPSAKCCPPSCCAESAS